MPQLHLYVSDATAERIKRVSEAHGVAVSRYLAQVISRELGESWPDGFFEDVVGAWQGEPLTRPDQGEAERRRSLESAAESTARRVN